MSHAEVQRTVIFVEKEDINAISAAHRNLFTTNGFGALHLCVTSVDYQYLKKCVNIIAFKSRQISRFR